MEKNICIFGASTTWGAWDLEKGGWVNRLRLFIDSQESDIFVYNLGVSGDNTFDLLDRFDIEAEARQPNLFIFSIGDNDTITHSNGEHYVQLSQYEQNIKELIKKSKVFTNIIVFVGVKKVLDESKTTPVSWDDDVHYTNRNIEIYNSKLRTICEEEGVLFLDTLNLMAPGDIEDGLHPNSQGHEKIFQVVKDFLQEKEIL
ncbi:MAG: GDSL-type esterase/lipase family protein [Patescibacteria group bacterium]